MTNLAKFFAINLIFVNLTFLFLNNSLRVEAKTFVTPTYTCDIARSRTTWNNDCNLEQFDSRLGVLESVTVSLNTTIDSNVRIENQDAENVNITLNGTRSITMERPDGTNLITSNADFTLTDSFASFDGVLDYDGESGDIYPAQIASDSEIQTYTTQDILNLFSASTSGQNISLPVRATSTSSNTGAFNLAVVIETFAAANASVYYTYTAHDLSTNIEYLLEDPINPMDDRIRVTIINNEDEPTVGTTTLIINLPEGVNYQDNNSPYSGIQIGNQLIIEITDPIPVEDMEILIDVDGYYELVEGLELIVDSTVNGTQYDYNLPNNPDSALVVINLESNNPETDIENVIDNSSNSESNNSTDKTSITMPLIRTGGE